MYDENRRRSCLISFQNLHTSAILEKHPGSYASEDVLKCLGWLPVSFEQRQAWLHVTERMAEKEQGNRRILGQFLLCFQGRLR